MINYDLMLTFAAGMFLCKVSMAVFRAVIVVFLKRVCPDFYNRVANEAIQDSRILQGHQPNCSGIKAFYPPRGGSGESSFEINNDSLITRMKL